MQKLFALLFPAFLLVACSGQKDAGQKDLLLGKWKVAMVDRGGDVMGGRGFDGSFFEFRQDGKVYAYNRLDTNIVQYERNGPTLTYKYEQGQEQYRIDSLTEKVLKIFSDADGVPTSTTMVRVTE